MDEGARQLRLLLVEDSPADVDLLLRELRSLQRPIVHRRVASPLHAGSR